MTSRAIRTAPRRSSMDNFFGKILYPLWPTLEANRTKIWVRQLPNFLTTLRLIISIPIAIELGLALKYHDQTGSIIFWSLVVIVLFASDGLDGTIANRLDLVSTYGRIVDPVADKVLVLALLVIYMVAGNALLPGKLALLLTILIVIRILIDVILSLITFLEVIKKRSPRAEKWGKRKLFTDAFTAVVLTIGLGLSANDYLDAGIWLVYLSFVTLLLAVYLGIRSIYGHWANLRPPFSATR